MYQQSVIPPASGGTLGPQETISSLCKDPRFTLQYQEVSRWGKLNSEDFSNRKRITKDKGILSPDKKEDSSDFLINNSE